ncbi:MAG: hypothetical protein LUH00_12585 [Lachnospiraceae bacterium]|nr:hypothetical protein [Lachnospiraceae bacterium]
MALLLSAAFPLVLMLGDFLYTARINLAGNLYMFFAILLFCVFYFRNIQVETIKKWVVLVLVILYSAAIYMIENMLCSVLPFEEGYVIYSGYSVGLYALLTLLLFPPDGVRDAKGRPELSG